jgi:DNA-binding protein YbaB
MVSFSKAKDMFRLQREAKRVKKELASIHVEAEGKYCQVVVSAEQEVVSITINPDADVASLPADLKDALNRAMKKAQVVSAEKMQGIMGEMGISTGS